MNFPKQFIGASHQYADYDRQVPAPYLRRSFFLTQKPKITNILVSGLGFYRLFVNGQEITKGILAPYISNPDDLVYFDQYEVSDFCKKGKMSLV